MEERDSEAEVEELLKYLYPNFDGGPIHTNYDNLFKEEPKVEAK